MPQAIIQDDVLLVLQTVQIDAQIGGLAGYRNDQVSK